jgi:hypothetical protein
MVSLPGKCSLVLAVEVMSTGLCDPPWSVCTDWCGEVLVLHICTRVCSCLTHFLTSTHFLMTLLGEKVLVNLKLNESFSTMSSKIHPKNIVMATLEEVVEDARKASEEHQRGA